MKKNMDGILSDLIVFNQITDFFVYYLFKLVSAVVQYNAVYMIFFCISLTWSSNGLPLRARGRGFPPGYPPSTMTMTPSYFLQKIDPKHLPSCSIPYLHNCTYPVNLWLYPWLNIELTHVVVNNNFASVERYRCKTLLSAPSKSQNWTAGRSFENEIQYYSFLEICYFRFVHTIYQ